jgi:3-phosphoshikimate 1-carboxyvinyltransferase
MSVVRVKPVSALRGTIQVPPDKSLTHRALLIGALSDRTVTIERPLDSEDTAATLGVVEGGGAQVAGRLGERLELTGVGIRGLRPPMAVDCMNSGTLMRLLTGILVGQPCDKVVLDGDDSLRSRPMGRVATPLREMGAKVWTAPSGTPPLVVTGGAPLTGMSFVLEVASAQVKSCLLLAGLHAEGETWVREPAPSRDHTERMLRAAGVDVMEGEAGVGVRGPVDALSLPDLVIPGDFSSAAPHVAAAALVPGSKVRLEGVNLNPARAGLLEVVRRMGGRVVVENPREVAGEPCGDLVVEGGELVGTSVAPEEVPSMIDELPLVALLGALARGETEVRGAQELRVKETDRIAKVVAALGGVGAAISEREDGFLVVGGPRLLGGGIHSSGDHRLAMLGAVAGLVADAGVEVGGFEAVAVSYPGFVADLASIGGVPG